jgi:N6-adenosine-specific RNA methylase IME4
MNQLILFPAARSDLQWPAAVAQRLDMRGEISATGWQLPEDMAEGEWLIAGAVLATLDRGIGWWIGDWWAYGERRYGVRKAAVEAADWDGPALQTCANAGMVARAFETSRRREVLSFSHHVEVAGLAPADADRLLDWCEEPLRAGESAPRSTRELRVALLNHHNRFRIEEAIRQAELWPTRRYPVIMGDPPWKHDLPLSPSRDVRNHYPVMETADICALPVRSLAAESAMLFLWTTPPLLRQGLEVMDAWGADYITHVMWDKEIIGMGMYARMQHEVLLFGAWGTHLQPPPSTLSPSVIRERRSAEHSRKPEAAYAMIERMYPGAAKLELVARGGREGWDCWGAEAGAARRGNGSVQDLHVRGTAP